MGLDASDVGQPDLIGPRGMELLFQLVLRHVVRLATVPAGSASVVNLCGDTVQRREPRHPILGYLLALVAQIVCQLAIAVDPATLG